MRSAKQCREMAVEVARLAGLHLETRQTYLNLRAQWQMLERLALLDEAFVGTDTAGAKNLRL